MKKNDPLALLLASIIVNSVTVVTADTTSSTNAETSPVESIQIRKPGESTFKAALDIKGLTSEQTAKLNTLKTEYAEKTYALRAASQPAQDGTPIDPAKSDQIIEKVKKLGSDTRSQIEDVLNQDQKSQFRENLKVLIKPQGDPTTSTAVTP